MDTNDFHSLMGFAALKKKKLNTLMDGQGSGEGLGE